MHKTALFISRVNEKIGLAVSWLTAVLVVLYCYDVLTRYAFNFTKVWIGEMEWHLYSLIFLLAAAYTLKEDRHVRVDVFYTNFSPVKQAWVNLIGVLFFLIPWTTVILITSVDFAYTSYLQNEGSPNPGGLPFRFIIKSAITIGFLLFLLQGIALLFQSIKTLRKKRQSIS